AGVEEARLIYLGVSHGLPASEANRLVIDIGGGSTELILGRGFEPRELESCYMGCVSYSQRFFADGAISDKAMRKAVIAARLELQALEGEYRQIGWAEAVGASGTVKAVGEVVRANGWCEEGITLEAMRRLADELVKAGHIDKLKLSGLKEERLPVFPGGVAVLLALFEGLQIEAMQVSDLALREGLLYDLVGRIRHEDVRERTIVALSERYGVDLVQAQRVESAARAALEQVAAAWGLEDEQSEHLLLWSARLHEIGLAIAHSSYHKHGAYLVANSDMTGFSSSEQKLMAILVRGHRRKFPTALFKEFDPEQKRLLQRLCILLRLAVLLHRSHTAGGTPAIRYVAEGKQLTMTFPEGWLAEHPLTEADLAQEADYLQSAKYTLEFS
ncbi:MAG: exopolyphosphatase, partial [Pseudomonadota bacterium]